MSRSGSTAPVPSSDCGREALQQVRAFTRTLLDEGKIEEASDFYLAALEAVMGRVRDLELLVAKFQRQAYGKTSERIDPAQLLLAFDAMIEQGGTSDAIDPEFEAREDAELDREIDEAEEEADEPTRKKRKKGAGWKTKDIERRCHESLVPDSDRTCSSCGEEKKRIGEDVTRRLEFVPARFVEHEHHLEKVACSKCKDGVTTAPAPPQVLPRSAAEPSLLAHLVVSKYADHCPLHRLHRIYARSGADIPVSTLADWMAGVGNLVAPLVERLEKRILRAYVVRTDATGLKVLDPQSPANIRRGTIWAYVGDDKDVLFRYASTGTGEDGPWRLLAGRTGYIQADGANVFNRLFDGQAASAVELGCWSHARRKLVELRDSDCRVAYPLKLLARLYRIEHLANVRKLEPDARSRLRKERTVPIFEKLKNWMFGIHASEPPGSALSKAVNYMANQWVALIRFVEDGRLSPDNNLCEQQIRDVALGRKNYLFAGSHDAAARSANLYSLTRTCAQHGVPPLPYLTDVLSKLAAGWDDARLDELLPHCWQNPELADDVPEL